MYSPLLHSFLIGDWDVVEFLLDRGASPHVSYGLNLSNLLYIDQFYCAVVRLQKIDLLRRFAANHEVSSFA